MGYDQNPVFSPDGQWLAWKVWNAMVTKLIKPFVHNEHCFRRKKDLSANFDQTPNGLKWTADSKSIYFVSCWHAVTWNLPYWRCCCRYFHYSNYKGVHDYGFVALAGDKLHRSEAFYEINRTKSTVSIHKTGQNRTFFRKQSDSWSTQNGKSGRTLDNHHRQQNKCKHGSFIRRFRSC